MTRAFACALDVFVFFHGLFECLVKEWVKGEGVGVASPSVFVGGCVVGGLSLIVCRVLSVPIWSM